MAKSMTVVGTASATSTDVALSDNKQLQTLNGKFNSESAGDFKVHPNLLWIEDGYNIREVCQDRVEGFVHSYTDGKYVPPIEVVVAEVDGVERLKVIKGQHRAIALQKLQSAGVHIEEIQVIRLQGDEITLLHRMIKSYEGRALTPIELADAYKRMSQLCKSQSKAAHVLGTTPAQITNYLRLLEAPEELKAMIHNGEYSATTAWTNIRKFNPDIALVMAKEDIRAKAERKAAKALGKKTSKAETSSKLKTFQLAPKKINAMSSIVTSLAGQVDRKAIKKKEDVELVMDASLAKLIKSLANDVQEMRTHNIEAQQNLKQITSRKKKSRELIAA